MWEVKTVVNNFMGSVSWDEADRKANMEALESIDMDMFKEMFGMYGIKFSDESMRNVFDFMQYVLSTYTLFLILPFVIVLACIILLIGSITSGKALKLLGTILMIACLILMIIPSGNFFGIMGIGPVVMMCGIVFALISAIGSFVNPGVVYVQE
jgi:hypothetical protein